MTQTTSEVLDKCINALRQGKTPQECAAVQTNAPADLLPLLKTAAYVRSAPRVQASEAAMRTGKVAFLQEAARLRAAQQRKPAKPWQRFALVAGSTFILPRRRSLAWTPALSLILALLLVLGTGTTAIAASRSLPDEPLYGMKLAGEQVQMALTTDPGARADLAMSNTEKRLDEISALANQGRTVATPAVDRLTAESQQALVAIGNINDDAMRPRLQRYVGIVAQQQAVLAQVQAVSAISEAISAALAVAQENERLAATAISDPSVLKDPQRSGRNQLATPKETATAPATPDPARMRTPAVAVATATEAPPAATDTPVPPPPPATPTAVAPTPTTAPSATATASATVLPQIRFSGVIEKVSAGEWVVGGKSVRIDGQTKIDGRDAARAGARADVTAVTLPGGGLLAVSITVHPLLETPAAAVTVRGIVLAIAAAQWNIGGQAVDVNSSTSISGAPALGVIAEATGTRKGDAITATAIAVKGAAPEVHVSGAITRISAQALVIGGQSLAYVPGLTSISGTPAVGASASATALRLDDGSLVAKKITVQAAPAEEEFEGFINRIDGSTWTVNGRKVVLNAATQLDESQAKAQVGLRARVRGVLQSDGSFAATAIRVIAASGAGHQASPTVTSPLATPTATRTPAASPTAATTSAPQPSPTATQTKTIRMRTPTIVP